MEFIFFVRAYSKWFIYKFKSRFILIISALCIAIFSLIPSLTFDDFFGSYFDRVPAWLEVKNVVDPEFGSSFYIFSDIKTNETDGITDPEYLKKLDEFESWLITQDEVSDVSTISDVIKTLHKNMNGGFDKYYKIPDDKALIAQYLLLYEFSVPYGMDLKNQMTADKSDPRMLIRSNNNTSMEAVAFKKRVDQWLDENISPYNTNGVAGIPIMMPHLFVENTRGLVIGLLISFSFIILELTLPVTKTWDLIKAQSSNLGFKCAISGFCKKDSLSKVSNNPVLFKLFSITFDISNPKLSISKIFLIFSLEVSSAKKGDTEIGKGSRFPLVISISTRE